MKIFRFFLLIMFCLNCTGCFQAESNLKITENGAVTMRNKFLGVPYIAGVIEESKNNLIKNNPNAKVKSVTDGGYSGYEVEIFYPDFEKFATNNIDTYQARPGKCTGVQISKGLLYDTCTFDLLFEGRKADNTDVAEAMAQALLAQVKFDFAIEIPYAAEKSNADYMSNDGKILTWNIAPAFINGQDKSIKLDFKIYHTLRIAATFFIVLLLIAGVIYNVSQSKKKQLPENPDDSNDEQKNFQNK